MLQRIGEWAISHYTRCMFVVFALALLGAQVAKFYFEASFHEAVTRAIKAIGL